MASIRFLVAGAILFAIFRPRSTRPTLQHWVAAAIVGAFLLVGGNARRRRCRSSGSTRASRR